MSKTLIIKSSEWLRASRDLYPIVSQRDCDYTEAMKRRFNSCLYSINENKSCCLGLDAMRDGISWENLESVNTPSALYSYIEQNADRYEYFDRWILFGNNAIVNSKDAVEAMAINDNFETTDEQKIAALRPIFAKHGITIDWRPDE